MMPFYGMSLHEILELRNHFLTFEETVSITLSILNILEQVHKSGYVFNDLKLENVLIGGEKNEVTLIDFGLCSRFVDEDGSQKF